MIKAVADCLSNVFIGGGIVRVWADKGQIGQHKNEKRRPFDLPPRDFVTRFVTSRYFPLKGWTSVNGASADLQGFQALPHILRP